MGLVINASAQEEPILGGNSAAADLNDPFTFGLNPALGEMTPSQIAAGYRVLHLGLLEGSTDLNTGGLVYTTDRFGGGLTLDAANLATPMWSLKRFRAGYGRRFLAGLSLGVSAGIQQRSFDLSDADLSQGSYLDPLLTGGLSRTVGTISLAAAYSLPLRGLTAGVVLENPHEPNISVGGYDDVVLPSTLRAGLSLERALFQVDAGMVDRQWRTTYSVGARGHVYGQHSFLGRIESDQWLVGARLGVSDRAWFEYTYAQPRSDLAELSSGSHGIMLCWKSSGRKRAAVTYTHDRLDDRPYDPNLGSEWSAVLPEPRPVEVAPVAPTHGFFTVAAESDTALIKVKRLLRVFGDGVDMNQVRRLPRWRIGVLDSTWSDRVTWDITEGMTEAFPENDLPRGNYSEEYRARMDSLAGDLSTGRGGDLVIAAEPDQLDRARYLARQAGADSLAGGRVVIKELRPLADEGLRRLLMSPVGPGEIPAREEITLYQAPAIGINIHRLGDVASISEWTLEILDSLDRPVRRLGGRGAPPTRVMWDWRDQAGRRVDVDQYSYRLHWRDADGVAHHTIAREILIARRVMQRTLEFGMERTPLEDLRRRTPTLILDPGRKGLSVGEETNKTGGSE